MKTVQFRNICQHKQAEQILERDPTDGKKLQKEAETKSVTDVT